MIFPCPLQHAYYIDYRNRRPDFIQTFMDKLVDWSSVASRYAAATK
jgi:Fe-Mn family superoxide dismutase